MTEFDKLPEHEKKLLIEIAKSQGVTVEELLQQQAPEPKLEIPQQPKEEMVASIQVEKPETSDFKMFEEAITIEEPEIPAEEILEEDNLDDKITTLNKMCPYCGWDQELPVLVEPTEMDKQGFLQSILGQKVFTKIYSVLGGNFEIQFRGLTLGEIDACYLAASKALKDQVLATPTDYYEYVNRLRLSLQLVSFQSRDKTLYVKLPEGLDKRSNPTASLVWEDFLHLQGEVLDEPLIEHVQKYVLYKTLPTEHMQRIVITKCAEFNKLTNRLEVAVNDENFWKEIELPL